MVKIKTPLGSVSLSGEYFANLVGIIVRDSYGIKGMSSRSPMEGLKASLFKRDYPEKGIKVYERNKKLVVDLHIKVVYGVNISAIVQSISEKVKYTVEKSTGLLVHSINVYVDEMVTE